MARTSTVWHIAALAVCAGLVMVAAPGCSAMRAASARNQVLQDRTAAHVYPMPCAHLWPAVQALLFERGFSPAPTPPGALVVETHWRSDARGSATWWTRYLAQAFAPTPNHCQIVLNKNESQTPGVGAPYATRDWEAEWVLLQRLDQPRAEAIAAEANAAGDKAATEAN
ncbi:MAG: hypothetical protein FJ100_10460 [Deltaproteobacteria bacterium]|nr:hypothetical protein [Deltaproteobacteria bacterium]